MAQKPPNPITGEECRAARTLIGWTRAELEKNSGAPGERVSQRTIATFETSCKQVSGRTMRDLRAALEAGGVEFLKTPKGMAIRRRPK